MRPIFPVVTTILTTLLIGCASQTQVPGQAGAEPGYNTPIPAKIMTPDSVRTRIGTLRFEDGRPTSATTQLAHDHLDFIRGIEVFLNFIPATSGL